MKVPNQNFRRSSALFRKQRKGFGTGFFLAISLLLFASSKVDHPIFFELNTRATAIISPFMSVVSLPVELGEQLADWGRDVFFVYSENRALRAENEVLKNWRQVAVNLELENARLKEILNVEPSVNIDPLITSRVIGVSGGPYVKSVLIDVGLDQSVREGMPVVNQLGVVGRTIMVGSSSGRVLLISDLNSRIPVKIERTNQNGIAIGRNGTMLDLMFLPVDKNVLVGDKVLTSGDGDAFPPDLMMGEVVSVDGDNIQILPSTILDELDFVQVLNFNKKDLEVSISSEEGVTQNEPNENEGGK